MGQNALGFFGALLVLFVIANSSFACSIAGQNAVTRVYYSLGRSGVFPKWLFHINAKTQTPDRAIYFQAVISLFFALLFGFLFGPLNGYGLLGLLFTVALMIVYIMTNVSCFALYYHKFRSEFKIFSHVIIPILATVAMLAPLAAALIPDIIFGPENANVYPITLGLPITIVWFVIGVGFYVWLRAKRPKELNMMANEMATVELVGEDDDPMSRALAEAPAPSHRLKDHHRGPRPRPRRLGSRLPFPAQFAREKTSRHRRSTVGHGRCAPRKSASSPKRSRRSWTASCMRSGSPSSAYGQSSSEPSSKPAARRNVLAASGTPRCGQNATKLSNVEKRIPSGLRPARREDSRTRSAE